MTILRAYSFPNHHLDSGVFVGSTIDVIGPTLLKAHNTDAPTAAGRLFMEAVGHQRPPNPQEPRTIGAGIWLWLPKAGRWTVFINAGFYADEVLIPFLGYEDINADEMMYLRQDGLPCDHRTDFTALGFGVSTLISSVNPGRLISADLCNDGANACFVNIGADAALGGAGRRLRGGDVVTWNANTVQGATVSAISAAGTSLEIHWTYQ